MTFKLYKYLYLLRELKNKYSKWINILLFDIVS